MSRWLYSFERRVVWSQRIRAAALVVAVFFVLLLLDRTIYRSLSIRPPTGVIDPAAWDAYRASQRRLESGALYQMCRAAGYLPSWIVVGAALLLQARPGRPEPRTHRPAGGWAGLLIIAAAALAGGVAEILKPLLGRLRPNLTNGVHAYRGYPGLDSAKVAYGLPSSHAAVAFGAAFMVAFLYPRAGVVALLAAVGCGVTRVLAGAHFATDILAAGVVGYAVAKLIRPGGWGIPKGWLLP